MPSTHAHTLTVTYHACMHGWWMAWSSETFTVMGEPKSDSRNGRFESSVLQSILVIIHSTSCRVMYPVVIMVIVLAIPLILLR